MAVPKRILSALSRHEHGENLFSSGERVLAAVSGGPDSVCLLHHLSRQAQRKNVQVIAVHIHHGLRGLEADRDANFVEKLCKKLDIPLILYYADIRALAQKEGRSIEDAARALRYRIFGIFARKLKCRKVATGHHSDDQAETLLLHLLRGKKAKGLAGIPAKRELREGSKRRSPKIFVVRPLLVLSRSDIRAYLKSFRLSFRKDSTNDSQKHTRNWIRSKVLPLLEKKNPGVRANLLAIAADVRKLAENQSA